MRHYTPVLVTRSFATAALLPLLVLLPAAVLASDFVGPESCKVCHPASYEVWRASRHAQAASSLPEKNRTDARCTTCHAPPQENVAAGVTCETCHGPGHLYARSYVMRDKELSRALGLVAQPGERTCAACHDDSAPSLTRFDFQKKMLLIEHHELPAKPPPRPGRPAAKDQRADVGKTS